MPERDLFSNISPLDHRYSLREEERKRLEQYFSEEASIAYRLKVELALVETLAARGLCSQAVAGEVREAIKEIRAEEVYEEERRTRHDIRALVNTIKKRVSTEAHPWLHFTATSMDIVETARSLCFKEANQELVLPAVRGLLSTWIELARRERDTLQIGRTHGQHALPITFGLALTSHLERLGERMERLEETASRLPGRLAGAVGGFNAQSLFFDDPEAFERDFLQRLGLEQARVKTQILPPEYQLDYLHAVVSAYGVLANFSDDMRHLQRSEIEEVGEHFARDQVGSSTMPHKRNPINYENVKSMWKEFMPRIVTHYLDQISEHQRDLTNSASSRFIPELITGFVSSINRLQRVCKNFAVDRGAMERNLKQSRDMILAEPLYLLLAHAGHPDAHEAVRRLTLEAEEKKMGIMELLQEKEDLQQYWSGMDENQRAVLKDPAKYTGQAEEIVDRVTTYWEQKI